MDSKFSSKCSVLTEVADRFSNDPSWQDFFRIYNLGIPTAIAVASGCVDSVTDLGAAYVEEAWLDLCRYVMVDSEGEFDLLDEMLEIGVMDEE